MTRRILLPLLAVAALLAAVPPAHATHRPRTYLVTFGTPDGSFKATITDPASIERIRSATSGQVGIPNGRLVRGTAENRGHEWHMEDVELVDMTIEVCDGTAQMVDDDVDYWVDTVGRYCPWGATMRRYIAR